MDAQAIKDALNGQAEEFARYLFPAGRKNGNEWEVGSVNGEAGQSFKIRIAGDKVGIFQDFGDGAKNKGSNLIELYRQARGVEFKDALHACAEWLGHSATPLPRSTAPRPTPKPSKQVRYGSDVYEPTDQECRDVQRMVETLISDFSICERIARARNWKPETIRQLAHEAHLGWHDGKLVFVYDSGAKLRWRENGERVIRWAFGKPWLWRGAWINFKQTIYLTEGETDSITLIDGDIESEPGTVVVALPSASTFSATWTDLFRGKDVILAFDNDKAGTDATAHVSRLLRPVVKSLKQLDWHGLQYATAS